MASRLALREQILNLDRQFTHSNAGCVMHCAAKPAKPISPIPRAPSSLSSLSGKSRKCTSILTRANNDNRTINDTAGLVWPAHSGKARKPLY